MTALNRLPRSQRVTRTNIAQRAAAQELPHEWLLRVARGECIKQRRLKVTVDPNTGVELSREWVEEDWYATFDQRMVAAKDAAPYYAPRLQAVSVAPAHNNIDALRSLFSELAARLPV